MNLNLTPARRRILEDIAERPEVGRKPTVQLSWLRAKGLIEFKVTYVASNPRQALWKPTITEEGRAVLAEHPAEEKTTMQPDTLNGKTPRLLTPEEKARLETRFRQLTEARGLFTDLLVEFHERMRKDWEATVAPLLRHLNQTAILDVNVQSAELEGVLQELSDHYEGGLQDAVELEHYQPRVEEIPTSLNHWFQPRNPASELTFSRLRALLYG